MIDKLINGFGFAACLIACRGCDVFVNMVLEDVTEYELTPEGKKVRRSVLSCEQGRLLDVPPSSVEGKASSAHVIWPVAIQLPPPTAYRTCANVCTFAQVTHLDQILLNGNNIALLVPGGKPEEQQ